MGGFKNNNGDENKIMMIDIQDLLDELEELAWNHADSYKINKIRNKIDEWLEEHSNDTKI